jgi:hypothetical protein
MVDGISSPFTKTQVSSRYLIRFVLIFFSVGPLAIWPIEQRRSIYWPADRHVRQQDNVLPWFVPRTFCVYAFHWNFAAGSIQLDPTAQLEDVFWGLYYWLDTNPTETVLVSIKIDNGDNTAALQQQLYGFFTDTEVADYWIHNNTVCPHIHNYQWGYWIMHQLSTLGACRHKLIPILRTSFDASNIPNYVSQGPYLGNGWLDNTANITMSYPRFVQ